MIQYLRNKSTGVVFERDNDIARFPHMIPCNADGSDIAEVVEAPVVETPVVETPVVETPVVETPKKAHKKGAN